MTAPALVTSVSSAFVNMKPSLNKLLLLALTAGAVHFPAPQAGAFSLVGPFDGFQDATLNYNRDEGVLPTRNPRINDLGGPQNLGEEYRRNVGGLFYAFDYAFLDFFGQRGIVEVDKAIKILNDLPAFSTMSADLSEFPLETQRINYRASALGLVDLKSFTMGYLLEQLGLLSPHQYAWTLRQRLPYLDLPCPFFQFWVIRRNFDPVTWEPTSYINGALYTYTIETSCPPGADVQDAAEVPVDPLAFNWSAVAENDGYVIGGFYSGLTRDDIGGLRYLYRKNNFNYEPVPANVFGGTSGGGSPWSPVDPSVTNQPISGQSFTMGGIDKLKFTKVYFDGLLGQTFTAVSNSYSVPVAVNVQSGTSLDGGGDLNLRVEQLRVTRAATFPDIVFSATDQLDGGVTRTIPAYTRSTQLQVNNGPGIMDNTITISFNKIGPYVVNLLTPTTPFVSEANAQQRLRFGAFDGSTNPPVIFPSGASIKELERIYFGGN
jgi:hypothetical protein